MNTTTVAPPARADAHPAAPTPDPARAIAAARAALGQVRTAGPVPADAAALVCQALRLADQLTAAAIALIPAARLERSTGLSDEMALRAGAGRTRTDARMLCTAAWVLPHLPRAQQAFAHGAVSYAVVRALVGIATRCDAAGRAVLDAVVGSLVGAGESDPDVVVGALDEAAAALDPARERAREDKAITRRFLSAQPCLGGGGSLYAEADAEAFATILGAIDAVAGPPRPDPDAAGEHDHQGGGGEPAPSARARQRLEALLAICEDTLAGCPGASMPPQPKEQEPAASGSPRTPTRRRPRPRPRPRPRFIATIDLSAATTRLPGARLHWALPGTAPRLSALGTEVAACDAEWVSVLTRGGRVIAVGDATAGIPEKLRRALAARDQGCRFPGCGAPAGWTDAHHILAREHGGPTVIDNLVSLCRRCHRRVHRYRWKLRLHPDGAVEFTLRAHRYRSSPPLARARE